MYMHQAKIEEIALLILRVIVAAIFIHAGYAKLGFWTTVPLGTPAGMVYLIKFLSIVEPLGGIALLVGFLTRYASLGLAIIMIGATILLRFTMNVALFTSPQGSGLDYTILIFGICFYFAVVGARSAWSIDAMRKKT